MAVLSAPVMAQQRFPIGDRVDDALMPVGIAEGDAVVSGAWGAVWPIDDATHVAEVLGEFQLDLAGRRLTARDAVVWLTPGTLDGRPYVQLDVFLWQNAVIVDAGGTTTRGSSLFASLATFGSFQLAVDRKAMAADDTSRLFQDATAVRSAALEQRLPGAAPGPAPLTSVQLAAPASNQMVFRPGPQAEVLDGEWVATLTDGLYFARGKPGDPLFIEGEAQSGVLFANTDDGDAATGETGSFDLQRFTGIYLEGDVRLTQGTRLIRAERLYYDLQNARAIILDAVVRVYVEGRRAPIYIRADEARQLSAVELSARNVRVGPSEFYTPHVHVGASQLYLAFDEATSDVAGLAGARSGMFTLHDTTFNVDNLPFMYLPWSRGTLGEGEFPLEGVRVSTDDEFGASVSTRWNLFNVLGWTTPPSIKQSTATVDYFSRRGLGLELDTRYETATSFGDFLGYIIHDSADRDDLGGLRDEDIEHNTRGRARWRHRQYLEDDWQATFHTYYVSDSNFLDQYYENEFDDDVPTRTYFELKHQRDNRAFTLLTAARINNWMSQTEALPDAAYRIIGEPLGPFTWFTENRVGVMRYEPDKRRFLISQDNRIDNRVRSGTVLRADTRQELTLPFPLGPWKVVPFVTGRGTWWDDTLTAGGAGRALGLAGLRGAMYLWRNYDGVQSDLLGIDGLRHLVKLDFTTWLSESSRDSRTLFPFQEDIEGLDGVSGGTVGLRQRWQTHRGSEDRRRTVDVLLVDLEAGFFDGAQSDERTNGYASPTRPEESISSNYVSGRFNWRLSDTTALLGDTSFDLDGGDLDIANLSVAVERTPRLGYFVGWRMIGETDSNLIGVGANYRATDKHAFAIRHYTDIDRGSTELLDFTYVRRFPRWYMAFTFAIDEIDDNTSMSVSIWPEGFPGIALGNKRYTGLATSTSLDIVN